ncbi:MAG: HIT family protein, partial [Armatimonadota bacterium]|nr:HIT family protein [Armatimonadota bacterium]
MAQHQENCEICQKLEQCRAGQHPGLIAELETGFAVLGDSQFFRGYCLLLCKTPATELDELPAATRLKYLEEMALLAQAVRTVVQPHKLNYECLGNLVPHLHWHVFPRYADEAHPEKPVWLCMP